MLDFIFMGSVDLRGANGKQKIQNKFLAAVELEATALRLAVSYSTE